jgi:hypothetical protein
MDRFVCNNRKGKGKSYSNETSSWPGKCFEWYHIKAICKKHSEKLWEVYTCKVCIGRILC